MFSRGALWPSSSSNSVLVSFYAEKGSVYVEKVRSQETAGARSLHWPGNRLLTGVVREHIVCHHTMLNTAACLLSRYLGCAGEAADQRQAATAAAGSGSEGEGTAAARAAARAAAAAAVRAARKAVGQDPGRLPS